jgi:predicted  nucleic acid-binding Zn-ribbon protein
MADQIELLKQLQAVDTELYRLRREQREKPHELEQATAQVTSQKAQVTAASERLNALQLSQKEKEMELQSREEHIKKLQGQLFQVKTNKEYTAMQREIDTLKADKSLLEETILGTFDTIEQAMEARHQEQARLAEEQGRFRVARERIERDVAAIEEQMADAERRRKAVMSYVPEPALDFYEQVLKLREGLALVPLLNDACGGCHRRLPPQVVNQVYLKAALVSCENCNRILYFDEAHSKL